MRFGCFTQMKFPLRWIRLTYIDPPFFIPDNALNALKTIVPLGIAEGGFYCSRLILEVNARPINYWHNYCMQIVKNFIR